MGHSVKMQIKRVRAIVDEELGAVVIYSADGKPLGTLVDNSGAAAMDSYGSVTDEGAVKNTGNKDSGVADTDIACRSDTDALSYEEKRMIEFVARRPLITCRRCGGENVEAYTPTASICEACAFEDNTRMLSLRRDNSGWMQLAADSGLDLWDQQPEETDWEHEIWAEYMRCYPGAKPTYGDLADRLGVSRGVVVSAARRWDYAARMQAWMQHVDAETLAQRRAAGVTANAAYISMAETLREKMRHAIDVIVPETLRPAEINALVKTAFDLEKKAGLDQESLVATGREAWVDEGAKELKKSDTPTSDLAEVIAILAKAGALGDITRIGVRKTEVTETIVETEGSDSESD